MPDEIMCIDKDDIPYFQAIVLAHNRFVHDLSIMVVWGYFYLVVYKYSRPGSLSNWIFVFKVARGASYKIQSGIEAVGSASR